MNPLRAAYAATTASRYLLGVVAGCTAPLWCRLVGHRPIDWPLSPPNVGKICELCGKDLEEGE